MPGLATNDDVWEDDRFGFSGMLSKKTMNSHNFSVLEIIKTPIQALFFALIAITVMILVPLTFFGIRNVINWSSGAPADYTYPHLTDL